MPDTMLGLTEKMVNQTDEVPGFTGLSGEAGLLRESQGLMWDWTVRNTGARRA